MLSAVSGTMDRTVEEFLSIVTHELKTPLTPLKSVAQLMRMRIRKARAGERELDLDALEKGLATIERQVDRMDRLVTDLLEVSRIGRGRFELQPAPFDLAATAREVVQRWTEATAEEGRHRFELDVPTDLTVTADRLRIEQVLMNFIANAVKFSPRGGTVSIAVEALDDGVRLSVRDEGVGITADELPTLGREPFVRGRRAQGGGSPLRAPADGGAPRRSSSGRAAPGWRRALVRTRSRALAGA